MCHRPSAWAQRAATGGGELRLALCLSGAVERGGGGAWHRTRWTLFAGRVGRRVATARWLVRRSPLGWRRTSGLARSALAVGIGGLAVRRGARWPLALRCATSRPPSRRTADGRAPALPRDRRSTPARVANRSTWMLARAAPSHISHIADRTDRDLAARRESPPQAHCPGAAAGRPVPVRRPAVDDVDRSPLDRPAAPRACADPGLQSTLLRYNIYKVRVGARFGSGTDLV